MKYLMLAAGLLIAGAHTVRGQTMDSAAVIAIEHAAATYAAKSLPSGRIALDPTTSLSRQAGVPRPAARTAVLAAVLGARVVRADSVLSCAATPGSCRLSVDALVQIGEPFASTDGVHIIVQVRRPSGIPRQPVSRLSEELRLQKLNGTWCVVSVAERNAS
jgi:hypothetical protein